MNKTSKTNTLFLCVLLFYIGGSILLSLLFGTIFKTSLPTWAGLIISQMLIFIPIICYLKINNEKISELIPYKPLNISNILICVLFAILMLPVVLFINMLSMLFVKNELQETVGSIYNYPFILQVLLLAVLPAVFEEFAFRGVFFQSFRRNNIFGAAILSGVMFGLMHLNFNQFAYAFVLGIVFAFLVEGTGSMFSSMTAHFIINMNSVMWMAILKIAQKFMAANAELFKDGITNEQFQSAAGQDMSSVIDSSVQMSDLPTSVVIMYLILFLAMAIIFGVLAFIVYRWLCIRNGRWEHIKQVVKNHPFKKKEENFINMPLVIAIIVSVGYMILTELL